MFCDRFTRSNGGTTTSVCAIRVDGVSDAHACRAWLRRVFRAAERVAARDGRGAAAVRVRFRRLARIPNAADLGMAINLSGVQLKHPELIEEIGRDDLTEAFRAADVLEMPAGTLERTGTRVGDEIELTIL